MRTPQILVTALLLLGLTRPAGGETFCDTTPSVGGYEITLSGSSTSPWDNKGAPLSSPYIRTLYLWAVASRPIDAPPEDGGISVFVGRLESATGGTSVLGFSPETGVLNIASAPEVALTVTDGCTGRELPFVMGTFSVVETATGAAWALAETDSTFPGTLGLFDCITVDGGGAPILLTDVSYRGYSSTTACPAIAGGEHGFSPALNVSSTADGDHWFGGFGAGEDGEGPNGRVRAIWARSFDEIFVGGSFTSAGDPPVAVNRVARWNGADTWTALGSGFTGGHVEVLTYFQGDLVAGGTMTSTGPDYIARFSGGSWDTLASISGEDTSLPQPVRALLADGATLYAGGADIDPSGSRYVAKYDGDVGWTSLGSGVWQDGPARTVWALALFGGDLIAGGDFDTTDGSRVSNIARFDGVDWTPLGATDASSGLRLGGSVDNAHCKALTVYKGVLLVGGAFDQAGDVDTDGLAIWDGCTWQPFFCDLAEVHALAVFEPSPSMSDLIAYGAFTTSTPGGVSLNRLVRWSGSEWTTLGTAFPVATSGWQLVGGVHYGLAADGNRLYIGGGFNSVGSSTSSTNIAMWREVEESVAVPPAFVAPSTPGLALTARPNPSRDRVTFTLSPMREGGTVSIYDVQGRHVAVVPGTRDVGSPGPFEWAHSGFPPGVYYAVWRAAGLSASTTVVVLQ